MPYAPGEECISGPLRITHHDVGGSHESERAREQRAAAAS
jgi:hypothetical protein